LFYLRAKVLEVIVDGVSVGKTPWDGRLGTGRHVVFLRGDDNLGTAPVEATLQSRQVATLTLAAELLEGQLLVETTPADSVIAINAVEVGRGLWQGRMKTGPHRIEVAAPGFRAASREVNLLSGQRETLKIALERDPDAALWRKPSKFVVEAAGFFGVAPVFGGDVESSCRGACSRSPGLSALATAYGGYELGSGTGFGVTAGYFFTERAFQDRAVQVMPMGLAPRKGQADETLRLTGVMLGAAAGLPPSATSWPQRIRPSRWIPAPSTSTPIRPIPTRTARATSAMTTMTTTGSLTTRR
jgi:hypothetical protein